MPLTRSIVRQIVVSSVLLSLLQCSGAIRFSRSMRYPAPSIRNSLYQWKYVPFSAWPRGMQRRFMWKDVDDTVDEMMGGVASGARVMTHMLKPSMMRYRMPSDFDAQSSTKIKYVMKKPPPPPPQFQRMKGMKLRAPKKTIPIYHPPLLDMPSEAPLTAMEQSSPKIIFPYMSEEELRKIEKEQERRVEKDHNESIIHEHSHQTHMDDDVVSGRINEFGEGWLPIQTPYSTSKSFAVSQLHTNVEASASMRSTSSSSSVSHSPSSLPPSPSPPVPSPDIIPFLPHESRSYDVTEHSAEESVQKEQTFRPSTHIDFLAPTTEAPNYPEYFLKNIQKIDEQFHPTRVHQEPTTIVTTSTSPNLSHRLPPRSTTERPFKRYNLHRPKSSKLFFNRPTSSAESTRHIQTTTTTEQSIQEYIPNHIPVIEEVIKTPRDSLKTTRESVRTTREPLRTTREPLRSTREPLRSTRETLRTTRETVRTTREPLKTTREPTKEPMKPSPIKVRNTRNDSDGRSKVRVKKLTQNENLNKILNRSRGMVKFGEERS